MTAEELVAYLARSIPEYAAEHVRTGEWTEAEALERSRADHAALLPEGVASPGHFLRTVHDAGTGRRVGEVWYGLRSVGERPEVYWIGIDPAFRRRGYAAATFRAVEDEARRLGADRLALHVFGANTGARALYETLGFVPVDLVLAKPVRP